MATTTFDVVKLNTIRRLLSQGLNVNATDSNGNTLLHAAVVNGHEQTVKFLIDAGADVSLQNNNAEAALDRTIDYCYDPRKKSAIMKTLIYAGADANTGSKDGYKRPALNVASTMGDVDLVKLLVSRGASVKAKDDNGHTALHCAASNVCSGEPTVFEVLMAANVDVDAKDNYGDTALHLLSRCKPVSPRLSFSKILEVFSKYGSDFSAVNDDGKTPVDLAIESSNAQVVKALLLSGEVDVDRVFTMYNGVILRDACDSTWKIALAHLAKLRASDSPIEASLLETISKEPGFESYFENCGRELELAKNTKVHLDCYPTFFNVLVDHNRRLVLYAGNANLTKSFFSENKVLENFPIYGDLIYKRFSKALNYRKIWDQAANTLSDLLPITVDPTNRVIGCILNYLSFKELRKLGQ